jgi:RNA polymerase sigma factor (sigma-70 family)
MRPDPAHEARFCRLVVENRRRLMGIARAYASGEDRADLYQEILLQMWRSLEGFEARSAIDTWVYRLALNTAITWRRRSGRRQRHEAPTLDAVEAVGTASPRDEQAILDDFLSSLGPIDRALLLLYLEDCSYTQISEITGLTEGAAMVRVSRLKSTFREKYV